MTCIDARCPYNGTSCPVTRVCDSAGNLVDLWCPRYPRVTEEPPGPPPACNVRLVIWGPDGKRLYDKEAAPGHWTDQSFPYGLR